jgi:predicted enzyme related to lactoylglutathione lyase
MSKRHNPISIIFAAFSLVISLSIGWALGAASQEKPMEKVTGIGGVFFKSKDPKATTEWYHKNLGVPVTEQGSFFPWKELEHPERTARTVWSPFDQGTEYFQPSTSEFMINYRVADLDKLLAQLRVAGVQIVGKTEDYPYGRFAWIVDPEGRKIELWQPIGE